jgi:predicted alpha/beta-fold hydrolase
MSYLAGYAIVGPALATLTVPSRIVAALDDPIIPAGDLVRLAATPALEVTTTERGGHCGFLDGFAGPSWADRQIAALLAG